MNIVEKIIRESRSRAFSNEVQEAAARGEPREAIARAFAKHMKLCEGLTLECENLTVLRILLEKEYEFIRIQLAVMKRLKEATGLAGNDLAARIGHEGFEEARAYIRSIGQPTEHDPNIFDLPDVQQAMDGVEAIFRRRIAQ